MKKPVYESMTKVVVMDPTKPFVSRQAYHVRLWRTQKEPGPYLHCRIERELWEIWKIARYDTEVFVKLVGQLPCTAAIELLRSDGCGEIFYPDWQ